MRNNIILDIDAYKVSMKKQYPPNTLYISSYIEARGSDDLDYYECEFFGIQYWIKEYLMNPIIKDDIDEAEELYRDAGFPFYRKPWEYILGTYGGYLPLNISAVPEGTILPLSNVLTQVINTDAECFWLPTWVETPLLRTIWYATTVATNSYTIKKILKKYYDKSGSVQGLDYKLHDFGSRGVSSKESAGIGGLAHLINFSGTDTVEAVRFGKEYYHKKFKNFSIPASEHSTMTTWGKEHEVDAFRNMLNYESPIIAVVSDSYDIYNAVDNLWGTELKSEVINSGKTIVIRPDSGDPLTVPITVIKKLMKKFGFTVNEKGYKTLPDCVRVIQGDGITKYSIKLILDELDKNKLSLDNISFGMGSGMLQQVNRDTLKFAMKASAIITTTEVRDVWKSPIEGGKQSKRGILGLYLENDKYVTKRWEANKAENLNILQPVYSTGVHLNDTYFENIIQRANR